MLPSITIPRLSDHGGELILLGIIAVGIIGILICVLIMKAAGWDVAAALLVLQAIIGAVKDRWNARTVTAANQTATAAVASNGNGQHQQ